MRHGKRGRKLGRTASHRRATMNNMATSLFMHGMIRTTKPKAKELRGVAERLITFAKRGDLHARRQVLRRIRNKVVVAKLFDEIAPTFANRQGGYTRVLSLGRRRGDATDICLIELVGSELGSEFVDKGSSQGSSSVSAPAAKSEEVVIEDTPETEAEETAAHAAPVAEASSDDDGESAGHSGSESEDSEEVPEEQAETPKAKSDEDEKT